MKMPNLTLVTRRISAKGLPIVTVGLLPERPALSKTKVFPRKLGEKKFFVVSAGVQLVTQSWKLN